MQTTDKMIALPIFSKRFITLCDGIYSTYGIDISVEKELTWLTRNYGNDSRFYHNISHIVTSLNLYDKIRTDVTDGKRRLALQFAIFYHDIIYVPQNGDAFNIRHSIESALDALHKFPDDGETLKFKTLVKSYIQATNHDFMFDRLELRAKMDKNSAYMSAIDLYNLSIISEQFKFNNNNIRQEYNVYSDEEFNNGQSKFLNKMLSLDRIYLTPEFSIFEKHARRNIQDLLKAYSKQQQQQTT